MPTKPKTFESMRATVDARSRYRFDPGQAFYRTSRWLRLRKIVLDKQPICGKCQRNPATDVDHIEPRYLRPDLEWDEGNLMALCKPCHTRKTNEERKHG